LGKRVFTTDEKLEADLEVAHFGSAPLLGAVTSWCLVGDDHKVAASGEFPARDIPVGNGIDLGRVTVCLNSRSKILTTIGSSGRTVRIR
jgi:hypothetical protein